MVFIYSMYLYVSTHSDTISCPQATIVGLCLAVHLVYCRFMTLAQPKEGTSLRTDCSLVTCPTVKVTCLGRLICQALIMRSF